MRPPFFHAHGNPGSYIHAHRDSHTGHHPCTQTHAVTYSNSDCGYYTLSHSIDNSNPTHSSPAAGSDSSRHGHADTIDKCNPARAYAYAYASPSPYDEAHGNASTHSDCCPHAYCNCRAGSHAPTYTHVHPHSNPNGRTAGRAASIQRLP